MDSVNLQVGQGETYGYLGLTGAGITTIIRALLGMIRQVRKIASTYFQSRSE